MNDSPTRRTPYEVWERILLYTIAVSTPVLDTTCTPSTYLSFKRTCGDGTSTTYKHEYHTSERIRRSLRLVCRAWDEFANRWDTRERWIRSSSLLRNQVSDEQWRGAKRIEFLSGGGRVPVRGKMPKGGGDEALYLDPWTAILFNWKIMGLSSGFGMRVKRLEMLYLSGTAFSSVFTALCEASSALRELRSLGLAIPANETGPFNEWPLKRISKFFPELVHLTLRASSGINYIEDDTVEEEMPGETQYDALQSRHLEVLLLFPAKHCFRLSTWSLPSLKHFHIRPVTATWKNSVFPFLERHADTIETLDLDDEIDDSTRGNILPTPSQNYDPRMVDFWNTFPRLAFLRCGLARRRFATYPGERHALKCFASIDSILDTEDLVGALSPWVEEPGVKSLERLVLFGPYLSDEGHKRDKGVVRGLLQQCQWNGIRVMNPAGRSWIDPL